MQPIQQYDYPTTIYFGEGSLLALAKNLKEKGHKKMLVVTDPKLRELKAPQPLLSALEARGISFTLYSETHANPREEDVEGGVSVYKKEACDGIIAFGGGSPMDVAKAIKLLATHPLPLSLYEDATGGGQNIRHKMPALYAIPTTAGTGSEVGRSSVIILKGSNQKNIIFHPSLMPDTAVLDPNLTLNLPPHLTAATGMDAFTHNLEAYFAPSFHPIAEGIALEGLRLIVEALPEAYQHGQNCDARGKMLIASTMGAVAFQKGVGMTHSLAHPLSAKFDMHHGLANALLLPFVVEFLEGTSLSAHNRIKIKRVLQLFQERGQAESTLAKTLKQFVASLGIPLGLGKANIPSHALSSLSTLAFADHCHQTNMIPVTSADLLAVYQAAF